MYTNFERSPPRLPEILFASQGSLTLDTAVHAVADVNIGTVLAWRVARRIDVRSFHISGLGYPLLGVRIASETEDSMLIDALCDVGDPRTLELFKLIERDGRLKLTFRHELGMGSSDFQLSRPDKAMASFASAVQELNAGDFRRDGFCDACTRLAFLNVDRRLELEQPRESRVSPVKNRKSSALRVSKTVR